jgi:hypothetical protein
VLERLNPLYPQFVAAENVLETGLGNIGAMFHPTATVLSVGRIESGLPYEFYRDMTPSITAFIEVMDAERLALAEAYGVKVPSAAEWLASSYDGIAGDTLYERIQSNAAYRGIPLPFLTPGISGKMCRRDWSPWLPWVNRLTFRCRRRWALSMSPARCAGVIFGKRAGTPCASGSRSSHSPS